MITYLTTNINKTSFLQSKQGYFMMTTQMAELIDMLTAHQMHKHTQSLMGQIYSTEAYEQIKQLLFLWRDQQKSPIQAITTFLKILQIISTQQPQLLDDLNRCLAKDYSPSAHAPSLSRLKKLAAEHPQSPAILDTVLAWLKSEQPTSGVPKAPQLQELSESEFASRLERHRLSRDIGKIINLYRRCILTLAQFKKLLEPIYLTDPSFFNMLFQYAEELETCRRKVTIFAPLNELVDQKYPLEQVGNSYILIPDGYSNWGSKWKNNPQEKLLNRVYCSVPLGTEGSFIITRKNQYEEQLLRNEEEKYEIDSNLNCIKGAINIIEKTKKLNHPLVAKILSNIYSTEVVGIMMRSSHDEVGETIVLPRLRQKLAELIRCRVKFQKVCQELSVKNFYKSLDHRCFYFCKNDKKFNCLTRWQKQIELRKKEVIQEEINNNTELQIEDRDSLQHSRHYTLNTFDNITTQELIEIRRTEFGDRRINSAYPPFPHNQILFLIDFSDTQLLNDVLEIILHHTQKKTLLELLIFKLFKLSIERKLNRQTSTLQFIEGRTTEWEPKIEPLNEGKSNKKVFKDLTDEFLELIEQDIEPAFIQGQQFPFEGSQDHTFIGTKQCYLFVRYLLTIYQRFLRAKSLSAERQTKSDEPSLYTQFLSVLIHKIKEQKTMEEYLRRIYQQDAYIFFTLDKLIIGLIKLVNNINVDSLTYKILRDDVRDYDLEIKRWNDYTHPSVTEQLTRLYREREILFRFSFSLKDKLLFISSWENKQTYDIDKTKKEGESSIEKHVEGFLNEPIETKNQKPSSAKFYQLIQNQYLQDQSGQLSMRGEEVLMKKRNPQNDLRQYEKELSRVKKLKLI